MPKLWLAEIEISFEVLKVGCNNAKIRKLRVGYHRDDSAAEHR